jgi:hypothetical protein
MKLGKRSDYERKPRDFYPTPLAAVKPLIPHLPESFTFCEPCAGDARLIYHIETLHADASCITAYDIEPQADDVEELDALDLDETHVEHCDFIITNPPWERSKKSGYLLHAMIERFSDLRPTWLLFDADWMHTEQSADLVKDRLVKIVSIGRVKWIEDSAGTGKDNCCWYLFDKPNQSGTEFHGRSKQK